MKLVNLEMLAYFKTKLEGLFVKQEYKTGSTTELKTLTDNNLTDELVEKINAAGAATEVTEEIATAKSEAIDESKSYTDTEVADALAEAKMYTDTAQASTVSSANTYTDTEVSEALAEAKTYADQSETDAVATAKSYTDEQITEAKSYADQAETDAIASAKTYTDTTAATAKSESVSESKTYTDTQVSAAKTELTNTINSKISSAYKIKGSSAFADLPALSADEEGNVYNVTDAFTTTDSFIEGAGQAHAAGANVVCVEVSEGVFKWDVLEGFIDTTVFVKNSDIETVTEAEIDEMFAA